MKSLYNDFEFVKEYKYATVFSDVQFVEQSENQVNNKLVSQYRQIIPICEGVRFGFCNDSGIYCVIIFKDVSICCNESEDEEFASDGTLYFKVDDDIYLVVHEEGYTIFEPGFQYMDTTYEN